MTVVGKILVFLNLVFSLVVGAFAVMDYTARTHWANYAQKLKDQNATLHAMNNAIRTENQRLVKSNEDLTTKLVTEGLRQVPEVKPTPETARSIGDILVTALRDRNTELANLRTTISTLRDEKKKADEKMAQYQAMEKAYTNLVNSRQSDSSVLRQQLKEEMDKNFQLVKAANDARDDMVQYQIQARTLQARNTQLEEALRKTQVDLAQAKSMGARGSGLSNVNPPPENVEGLVRRAEGNLVTISLGSDAGLSRNQTLEVFRLGQNPKYIGRIRIVEVTPTQAIGMATGRLSTPIQVGDRVASRIVGGY